MNSPLSIRLPQKFASAQEIRRLSGRMPKCPMGCKEIFHHASEVDSHLLQHHPGWHKIMAEKIAPEALVRRRQSPINS